MKEVYGGICYSLIFEKYNLFSANSKNLLTIKLSLVLLFQKKITLIENLLKSSQHLIAF